MKTTLIATALASSLGILGFVLPASAADEATMMSKCNTYAARHLGVSTTDIVELKYEGTRTDGTHAVNGSASNGQTFQCSFGPAGKHVVNWTHSAPTNCPADVSEADRYMYPACG
ncbi:hypothetical protein [Paracoccus spongiarum]|uniref:Uncharacterized protein n=1 Tax=Paracoccus spongiarum TaxID=3064387 RepID=A0ABT9J8L2_9RHOB|nr:hypothetical protein [Paracoccus sp. 2205BS29-5]MDP5306157.1 hypothetical protein [Paracoccus sp. 2205BS29-5]